MVLRSAAGGFGYRTTVCMRCELGYDKRASHAPFCALMELSVSRQRHKLRPLAVSWHTLREHGLSGQAFIRSVMAGDLDNAIMAGASAMSLRSLVEIVVSFVSGMQVAAQRSIRYPKVGVGVRPLADPLAPPALPVYN